MHKVLVDPGNAADLLQLPTFRQMNISLDGLRSASRILFGFNGATTVTMSDIALPVKAGPVSSRSYFNSSRTWAGTMPLLVENGCMH